MTTRYQIEPRSPGIVAVVDSHAGGEVVAYAPPEKADQVRVALERQGEAIAGIAKLSALVRSAYLEGGLNAAGKGSGLLGFEGSQSQARLRELLVGQQPPAQTPPEPVELTIIERFKQHPSGAPFIVDTMPEDESNG